MVKLVLIDKDMIKHANIHFEDDIALNIACFNGNFELVKFLLSDPKLEEHADIHNQGNSPLLNACKGRVQHFKSEIGSEVTYKPFLKT